MPELPEVETIARGLAMRVSGDVIESIWLGEKPEPLKSPAPEIAAALENTRILAVHRVGNHIVFALERGGRAPCPPPHTRKSQPQRKGSKPRPRQPLQAETEKSIHPTKSQWIVHLGMT